MRKSAYMLALISSIILTNQEAIARYTQQNLDMISNAGDWSSIQESVSPAKITEASSIRKNHTEDIEDFIDDDLRGNVAGQ